MRNRKTIMGFGLLAAVLFLAVGYAAISNIDFSITGTASAEVDTGLFEVAFDKNEEKTTTSNTGTTATVTASVTGDQSAEFVVSGLKKKNETVTATYTIKNSSDTLDAELSKPLVTLSGDTTDLFEVTAVYGNGSEETPILEVDDTITLTVTVKMKKTPIDTVNDVKPVTISISFSAEPVQPGSGGSSSGSLPETEDPVYYGKHYFMKNTGISTSIVLNEDGSFEYYEDCLLVATKSYPAGSTEIIDQQIMLGGTLVGMVSTDKKSLIMNYSSDLTYEFVLSGDGTCVNPYTNLPMLAPRSTINSVMYINNIMPSTIKSITLETTINVPEGVTTFDLSVGQNGKVIGYVTPNAENSNYYELHIEGDGGLYAPVNSTSLFSSLTSLTEMNNLNKLDTSKTTIMANMFGGINITSLDLSNFDTSNVTNMYAMFEDASNLTTLDLTSFDTSNVTDMGWMFEDTGYKSTEFTLNLGNNFNTSNVTDMSGMFQRTGYNSTKFTLDCSNWNVDKVTNYRDFNDGVESKVTAPTWKN